MILHVLYYIYKVKKANKSPELYEFLIQAKNSLNIKQINMEAKGQHKKIDRQWASLLKHM